MRAYVELTASEKRMLLTLTPEEREAVFEQMLAVVREELEWTVVVDRARAAAAAAPMLVAEVERRPPSPPPPSPSPSQGQRFRWPSTPLRSGARR